MQNFTVFGQTIHEIETILWKKKMAATGRTTFPAKRPMEYLSYLEVLNYILEYFSHYGTPYIYCTIYCYILVLKQLTFAYRLILNGAASEWAPVFIFASNLSLDDEHFFALVSFSVWTSAVLVVWRKNRELKCYRDLLYYVIGYECGVH